MLKAKSFSDKPIDFVVTPSHIMAAHAGIVVLTSLYMRLRINRFRIEAGKNSGGSTGDQLLDCEEYRLNKDLLELVETTLRVFLEHLKRLSLRYYHAWRITRAQSYLKKVYKSDEFYKRTMEKTPSIMFDLDITMMLDLINLFSKSIAEIGKYRKNKSCLRITAESPEHEHETNLLNIISPILELLLSLSEFLVATTGCSAARTQIAYGFK